MRSTGVIVTVLGLALAGSAIFQKQMLIRFHLHEMFAWRAVPYDAEVPQQNFLMSLLGRGLGLGPYYWTTSG